MKKITYSDVGDNYETKDPVKKLALSAALKTGRNLKRHGFSEVTETRGESAYVWKQGNVFMASVVEGLGTKTLVADEMRKITGKTYYDLVANDTVASIINDLVSVGAKPLVVHAYWTIEDNEWLQDKERMADLITGWKKACDIAGASWGGGETATMKGVNIPSTVDLAGSAVGIISSKKGPILEKNLKKGDRIILVKSTGLNANGISLARAISKRLPKGYGTRMKNGQLYGEGVLNKSNIYAHLVQDLLESKVDIHYISNITGHGLRKIMRARGNFTYVVEKIFDPQEIFLFIQKYARIDDREIYSTYNMGQDYVIFVPQRDVKKTLEIIKKNKFKGLDAGYIEKGERQVIIKPKNLVYKGESLNLR